MKTPLITIGAIALEPAALRRFAAECQRERLALLPTGSSYGLPPAGRAAIMHDSLKELEAAAQFAAELLELEPEMEERLQREASAR